MADLGEMLKPENIFLNQESDDRVAIIRRCGKILADAGYVNERYIDGMVERDSSFTCAIGNFIAIPHGEKEYKTEIKKPGFAVLTYPKGVDWSGQPVKVVIGIAAQGDEHIDIIGNIVDAFDTEDDVNRFLEITDKQKVIDIFMGKAKP
jgi:mannitol/fructose-specific phosphotransferase system IIA component